MPVTTLHQRQFEISDFSKCRPVSAFNFRSRNQIPSGGAQVWVFGVLPALRPILPPAEPPFQKGLTSGCVVRIAGRLMFQEIADAELMLFGKRSLEALSSHQPSSAIKAQIRYERSVRKGDRGHFLRA